MNIRRLLKRNKQRRLNEVRAMARDWVDSFADEPMQDPGPIEETYTLRQRVREPFSWAARLARSEFKLACTPGICGVPV